MLKRIVMGLLVMALAMGLLCAAENAPTLVNVSVVCGDVVLACEPVETEDTDGDGVISINDALVCAHAQYCELGADGYGSEITQWGISMTKLWGTVNGGSYGYYLNNASPASLADEVKNGDFVCAYAYTDMMGFSDTYCYFAVDGETAYEAGAPIALSLFSIGWDENWAPVSRPAAGASVLVNGVPVNGLTDENGCITLTILEPGEYVITAETDAFIMVTPCLRVTVK